MHREVERLEQAERRFRRDIWSVAPVDAVSEAGVRMESFGPILASVFGDLPHAAAFNLIQGAAEPGAVADGYLARAIDWVSGFGVEFMVPVPTDRAESKLAEEWLQWHDYEQGLVMKRYTRATAPSIQTRATHLQIRELPPREDELIAVLAGRAFGLPHLAEILFIGLPCLDNWRCYTASVDGEIAATGSTMIHEGVATLGIDATLSEFRGHGCHRALLERRLDDIAATEGLDYIQAFSSDMPDGKPSAATRSLHRAGFGELGRIVSWQRPRQSH